MNEVARCGELWFLCGPVFNLTHPMYWIATFISGSIVYRLGYCAGRDAEKKARREQAEAHRVLHP